jgi:TPR repeat protein
MYNLGMIFLRGYGTRVDRGTAAGWLEKAAQLGDREAQFYLGMLYFRGTTGGGNAAVAAHWFELAADQGLKEAQFNLALLLLEGKGITPDEARAVSLLEHLGETHPDAELLLARTHLQHANDPPRLANALRLFRKLAESGRPEAQSALGMMYLTGTGVSADAEEGRFWVAEAAHQGYAPAAHQLADIYAAGAGVPRDLVEAQAWYAVSAALGNEAASVRAAKVLVSLTPSEKTRAGERQAALQVLVKPPTPQQPQR